MNCKGSHHFVIGKQKTARKVLFLHLLKRLHFENNQHYVKYKELEAVLSSYFMYFISPILLIHLFEKKISNAIKHFFLDI